MINKLGHLENYLYKSNENEIKNSRPQRSENQDLSFHSHVKSNKIVSFKGASSKKYSLNGFISFMEKDARAYCILSLFIMTIPRTIIDFCRNFSSGLETAFYEFYGMSVNYLLSGFVALGIAKGIEKLHNYNKNPDKQLNLKLWANNKTIDAFLNVWNNVSGKSKEEKIENYLRTILSETEVLRENKWIKIEDKEAIDNAIKSLSKLISRKEKINDKMFSKRMNVIIKNLAGNIGARDSAKLNNDVKGTLSKIVEDSCQLAKNYFIKAQSSEQLQNDLKTLKKVNNIKTIGALSLITTATFSSQYIARWITYKRTGKKEFVGYCDFDKSKNRNQATNQINKNNSKKPSFSGISNDKRNAKKPSFSGVNDVFQSLVFKGPFAHPEQVKYLIWPACAVGSVTASRDENEERERALKSGFSLINFFFLPDLVEKLVTYTFNKDKELKKGILNYPTEDAGFFNTKIKSLPEILDYSTNKVIKELESIGENLSISKIRSILEGDIDQLNKLIEKLGDNPKSSNIKTILEKNKIMLKDLQKLKKKSKIMAYAYTFATVGAGIPIMNAIMTENRHKRQLAKQQSIKINNVSDSNLLKNLTQKQEIKELFSDFIK